LSLSSLMVAVGWSTALPWGWLSAEVLHEIPDLSAEDG